jgi:CRISPR/Cas system-associated protein Csm6
VFHFDGEPNIARTVLHLIEVSQVNAASLSADHLEVNVRQERRARQRPHVLECLVYLDEATADGELVARLVRRVLERRSNEKRIVMNFLLFQCAEQKS